MRLSLPPLHFAPSTALFLSLCLLCGCNGNLRFDDEQYQPLDASHRTTDAGGR